MPYRMKLHLYFLLILFMLQVIPASAATYMAFDRSSGIADDTVTSIAVQKDAVVWAGTINGLSRYEGVHWVKYTREAGCLPDDTVWDLDIQEDTSGTTLWVATGGGLASYDGSTWKHWTGKHYDTAGGRMVEGNAPLSGNVIQRVLVQRSPFLGKTFVFVVNMGKLYKFDGQDWATYNFSDRLKTANITCIAGLHNDRIWIGTDNAGLMEFNLETMKSTFYGLAEGLPSLYITSLHTEADYDCWIGTDKGLARLLNGKMEVHRTSNSKLPSDFVTCINRSFHNQLLVGTDKGLALYVINQWESVPDSLSPIQKSVVWDVEYFNPRGKDFTQTWLATRGRGVAVYQVPKDPSVDLAENKVRDARRAYVEKRFVDAIRLYKDLIGLAPSELENYLLLADSYSEIGDDKNAEHYLQQAMKLDDKAKPVLEKLGAIQLKMDNAEAAEKTFQLLVNHWPDDIDGYLALGKLHARAARWDKAISNFRKAMRINGDIPGIYMELSDAYLSQGNLMKALDIALQLQYKIPDNPDNNVRIGRIYLLQNRLADAVEEFNKVFLLEDNHPMAKASMARVHMEKGEYDKVEPLVRQSLKLKFDNGEAHALLAIAQLEAGKTEGARIELNYARSFDQNNPIVAFTEGRLQEAEGKYDDALKQYRLALQGGLKTGNLFYQMGNCHKSLEDYDEALEAYRNVLAVEPNFRKAEDVKWIISKLETPTQETAVPVSSTGPGPSAVPLSNTSDDSFANDSGNIEELDF